MEIFYKDRMDRLADPVLDALDTCKSVLVAINHDSSSYYTRRAWFASLLIDYAIKIYHRGYWSEPDECDDSSD